MSSQRFTFPPPPPPPPSQQQQQQPQQPHAATFSSIPSQYGQGYNGQRGGRGGSGNYRGRGRGYGNRGGGRGGSFIPPNVNNHAPAYATATHPSIGYPQVNYPNFPAQALPTAPQSIPTPQFTPSRSSHFPRPPNSSSFSPPQQFSQPTIAHGHPYQHQPNYDTATYAQSTTQSTPTYSPAIPPNQHASPSTQPPMMGPPMRWGFGQSGPAGPFPGPQRNPRPFNAYNNQAFSGDRPMKPAAKRDHTSAFGGKPQSIGPRVPAPPPVPSFGNPLPSKPPAPADATRKSKKKRRKHNQLGLTPKTEEHESSEEEDDVDEESRLAPTLAGATAPMQFTYRGQTSTLQSGTDIAAWIEERKKRFPTKAKIEEKKKAMEEAKKARGEALRQKDAQRQEQKRAQKDSHGHKDESKDPTDPVDAAAKAKLKADKLRRKLAREEKRVAKAEADAERARLKVEELQNSKKEGTSTMQEVQSHPIPEGNEDIAPDSEAQPPNLQGEHPEPVLLSGESSELTHGAIESIASEVKASHGDLVEAHDDENAVISSSDISDSSDWTSSSGSDISSSDSNESDDDSAPEEVSSRREGPERVPPPARENIKKKVCRHFARNGRCMRGDKCKFLHEMPERAAKAKPADKKEKGRKGLLQALLDRQKEDENQRVMEVIAWLGENGHLDETKATTDGETANKDSSAVDESIVARTSSGNQEPSGGMAPTQQADIATTSN